MTLPSLSKIDETARLGHALICGCASPVPEPAGVLGYRECRVCGRLIAGTVGWELLSRVVDLLRAEPPENSSPDGARIDATGEGVGVVVGHQGAQIPGRGPC